jgi:hypothetical protein
MKLKKGDLFVIDVDAFVADKVRYFRHRMPIIADKAQENAEPLRGKIFRVHRIENYGGMIVFECGDGLTGIGSAFCKRVNNHKTLNKS